MDNEPNGNGVICVYVQGC